MASTICSLEYLPDEIIMAIAEHSEPATVLAFSSASKRLRDICYQTSVFKNLIFLCQTNYLRETRRAETKSYIDRLGQIPHMTTRIWARYAILEEVLQRLEPGKLLTVEYYRHKRDIKFLRRCQTALIANSHPCLQDMGYQQRLRRLSLSKDDSVSRDTPGLHPGSLGLLQVVLTLDKAMTLWPHDSDWFDRMLSAEPGTHWLEPGTTRRIPDREIGQLLRSLCDIIYIVHTPGPRLPPNYIHPPSFASIVIPDSWRLKGLQFNEGTVQGAESKLDEKTHMGSVCTHDSLHDQVTVPNPIGWLTTGTWTGYYDYNSRPHWRARIMPGTARLSDGPMRNIRFQVVKDMAHSVKVRAMNCSDGVGMFDLFLEASKQDGHFRGTKNYRGMNMHNWDWYGMITPFGIFAAWGPGGSGGYVWLWKEN